MYQSGIAGSWRQSKTRSFCWSPSSSWPTPTGQFLIKDPSPQPWNPVPGLHSLKNVKRIAAPDPLGNSTSHCPSASSKSPNTSWRLNPPLFFRPASPGGFGILGLQALIPLNLTWQSILILYQYYRKVSSGVVAVAWSPAHGWFCLKVAEGGICRIWSWLGK